MKLETPQYIKDRIAALTALSKRGYRAGTINTAIEKVLPFIEKSEGYRSNAYWDKIGKKWTVGHGHTMTPDAKTGKMRPVVKGDVMSENLSRSLVRRKLWDDAIRLMNKTDWARYLSSKGLAGLLDVSFNAGVNTLMPRKSPSLNRKMNAPRADRDAVVQEELSTYVHANGEKVPGLENRRNALKKLLWPSLGTAAEKATSTSPNPPKMP